MACRNRLIDFLETQAIPYRVRHHVPTHTAQEEASAEHLPGHRVAKVVVVMADERPVMLVLAADRRVDFDRARALLRRQQVRLAREDELATLFPDCEIGAMPPFGNWYGVPVFFDADLARERDLTFYLGRRDESVTIPTWALERFSRAETTQVARGPHPQELVA